MAAQDPHHPLAKAHHTSESDHAAQVLFGGLQTTHDHRLKDNVKSTRHLHLLQLPDPIHPSISHGGESQEPTTHPPYNFPPSPSGTPPSSASSSFYDCLAGSLPPIRSSALRGVGRGSIGGIGQMSMLLLPLEVPFHMNDRDRQQVLEDRRCRAMVGEGSDPRNSRGYMPPPPSRP